MAGRGNAAVHNPQQFGFSTSSSNGSTNTTSGFGTSTAAGIPSSGRLGGYGRGSLARRNREFGFAANTFGSNSNATNGLATVNGFSGNNSGWPSSHTKVDASGSMFSGFSTTPVSDVSHSSTGMGGFDNPTVTPNAAKWGAIDAQRSETASASQPQWSSSGFGFQTAKPNQTSTASGGFGFGQASAQQSGFTQASQEQLKSYYEAPAGSATSSAFGEKVAGSFDLPRFGGFGDVYAALSQAPSADRFKDAPPVIKSFYEEHPEVTAQSAEEVAALRARKNNISVQDMSTEKNREAPKPIWKFEHAFCKYPEIMEEIRKNKFEEPSPIQCQMWPVALSGYDVVGIAQTGTGKTLAFLLPAFIHVESQPIPRADRVGPTVLVLTPTRELALQIEREVKKYSYKGIRSVCVYGGGCRRSQVDICGLGVEIVIATPGRLNDLVQSGNVDLSSITYLVLDEADRMLDMGFEPQIRKILMDIRPDRHTMLTSATWPPIVRELAQQYTKDAFMVVVGSLDLNACANVEQLIEIVEEDDKRQRLLDFIRGMQPTDKALIFVARKRMADHLSSDLSRMGIECQALHGDRDQLDREQALRDLRRGRVRLLVATDVASRGLDVPDITHVFNYDFPGNIEEYVHRVGRTGRAGKFGQAITLMTRSDWRQSKEIIAILEKNNQNIPPELRQMATRYEAMVARMLAEGNDPNARPYYGGSRNRASGRAGGGGSSSSNAFYDPFTGECIGTRSAF